MAAIIPEETAMRSIQKISPCLWFDDQAEQAANFYTTIFPNSKVCKMSRYGEDCPKLQSRPPGSVMSVSFELEGQSFFSINGGPRVTFNAAVSFMVNCDSQEEIDYYWERLSEGAVQEDQQCGWLKDQYGAAWQILPRVLHDMMTDPDPAKSQRVMEAMLPMQKVDLNALKRAFNGLT
jgi:predicted 3-demethylubiquinone-9 3-methyltransferase (glyoxalase superfamily)